MKKHLWETSKHIIWVGGECLYKNNKHIARAPHVTVALQNGIILLFVIIWLNMQVFSGSQTERLLDILIFELDFILYFEGSFFSVA